MTSDGVDESIDRSDHTKLSLDAQNSDTMLSAFAQCAWQSLVGWIIPLAVVLFVVPNVLIDPGLRFDGANKESLRPNWGSNTAHAQSAIRQSASVPFDLSKLTVPREEILLGGPPKDGIPALSNPRFITAKEATFLRNDDRVIGFVRGQEARAYPLRILNYHEVVNDRIGDMPIAISYCPLCDSAAVFDRRTPLGEREFGVSGLLYNSNVLMYDRSGQADSLWSQIKAEGVSGPGAKLKFKPLPVELTTWSDWLQRHPNTLVLSVQTGHGRDYRRNPYAGYFQQPGLMFPVRPTSDRLAAKERVLGVWTDKASRAYPESALGREPRRIDEQIGGKRVVIKSVPTAQTLRVIEADEGVQWMYSFWFAWYAIRPETEVFQ